jgi:MFS transporter, DHA1 family, inner membrane transport protein
MALLSDPRKQVLYLLALVNFFHIVDFMMVMPLGEELMRSFSISPASFSWLVSSYTLSAGISGFLGAFLLDRLDKRQVLLFTFLGFSLGTVLCALAYSYHFLLIARSVTGFFGGVTSALLIAMVSDLFSYRERGFAIGVLSAAFSAASVIGVPFGLLLANQLGWQLPFWVLGILSIAVLVILFYKLPAFPPLGTRQKRSNRMLFVQLFKEKNQWSSLILGFLIVFGHFLIIPFITPYLVRNVSFSEAAIPWVYMIGGACTLITAPMIGKLTDRLGAQRTFSVILIYSLVPVFLLSHMGMVSSWLVIIVTSTFFIFGSGRMIPAQTLISGAVLPEQRGSFMSFRSAVQQLATALAALVAGMVVSEELDDRLSGFQHLGYFSIAVLLLSLLPARRIDQVS